MSNENEKNRVNILWVKIKDFIVLFLNVQSIMCTLTRFNNKRSKNLNICMSKMHLPLAFRWIKQNVMCSFEATHFLNPWKLKHFAYIT